MLRQAAAIAAKDLRLVLARGTGLIQALLLGLLLIFVFSLSLEVGQTMQPQGASAIFWLASAFCQVLIFNTLFGLEEQNGARFGLLLAPMPVQSVWIGKALAGLGLLLCAQAIFVPATVVFLGQNVSALWGTGLAALLLTDLGIVLLGSLLGALSQGQAARESLLSIILFPLLIPVLLAGIRIGAAAFSGDIPEGTANWLGLAGAFDALFAGTGLLLFGFVYSGEE
ncbi:heme exporter protein CcmB [Desulfovibrio psychrotolerans]|uniref:Cytochrome C biogenesis protein CcmB n=1 Tax=Desulfovibrio psychrotolerans TaxID=415242 RepID=A0A7J0BQ37_9BACT|nr:heme exporter protein CcmB [Desulfovibrio psychrotolerans]GFM35779.1 cytochrome C biogenesis protein CcmB [Desulfovibrio psychrotolerans]